VLESQRTGAQSAPFPPEFVTDALTRYLETHGLPSILMGFGLADGNLHAPNENDNLACFRGGTKSCACLYEKLAKGA
jgi:acetylornithine deacetylase/succinyl-diaminopimelate desuccinylase-like protein